METEHFYSVSHVSQIGKGSKEHICKNLSNTGKPESLQFSATAHFKCFSINNKLWFVHFQNVAAARDDIYKIFSIT